MTDESPDDGPYESVDGLDLSEDVTAAELQESAEAAVESPLIESAEKKLAAVEFTFVDANDVSRTWSVEDEGYDPEAFENPDDEEGESE